MEISMRSSYNSQTRQSSGWSSTGQSTRRKRKTKKRAKKQARSLDELKNPYLNESAQNSYGRATATAGGKPSKQSIYFPTGSRYNICDYPELDDPADDSMVAPSPSSIGKMNSSMLRTMPQQAWGRAARTDYTKMYLSAEQCKGGQALDSPGSNYVYNSVGKQGESIKRTAPIQAFLSEFRKDMGMFAPEQFAGETVIVQADRCKTEFGERFDKRHMDKVKHRVPAFKFGSDTRKPLSDEGLQCSPGPVYKVASTIGKGPSFSVGTSKRQKRAFGTEVDERSYATTGNTKIGATTHYSRLKSANKCGFGSYSSRSQPVMTKLDANW